MPKSTSKDSLNQKAYEISYALIRVAAYIRILDLRIRIQKLAFQFIEEIALEGFEGALHSIDALSTLIKLGKALYQIEPINAKMLFQELEHFNLMIRQFAGIEELNNIESFFSKLPAIVEKNSLMADGGNGSGSGNGNGNGNGNGDGNGINAAIRQSAILERIRQSGNQPAQPRDLLAAFPGVSERTLRYDLQKLCLQGLITRVGNSGPATYYVIK